MKTCCSDRSAAYSTCRRTELIDLIAAADCLHGPVYIDQQLLGEPSTLRAQRLDLMQNSRACGPSHANVASNSRTGLVPVDETAYSP